MLAAESNSPSACDTALLQYAPWTTSGAGWKECPGAAAVMT